MDEWDSEDQSEGQSKDYFMDNSHVRNIPKMQGETRLSPHPRPLMWQMPLWGGALLYM
jgi:hypothetical protein